MRATKGGKRRGPSLRARDDDLLPRPPFGLLRHLARIKTKARRSWHIASY